MVAVQDQTGDGTADALSVLRVLEGHVVKFFSALAFVVLVPIFLLSGGCAIGFIAYFDIQNLGRDFWLMVLDAVALGLSGWAMYALLRE